MRPVVVFPLLLATSATFALAGCGASEGATDDVEAVREPSTAVPVHTSKLELAGFADTTKVFGALAPLKTVRIQVETTGRIESLPVDDGTRVKRGTLLARINARTAAAQLKQAEATLEMQQVETARTEKLVAKLAPPQQLDVARAQLKQAEAMVELNQAQLAKSVIRAPIAGIVVQVNAEEGEVASMGLPLLTIVDISSVVVGADVPERDVALMETGKTVAVQVEAFPDRVFPGLIGYIDYISNIKTRTFLMKIGIDNEDGLLRPGMLASLELQRQTFKDVVVVPRDAVIDDLDGKSVYIAEGGVARQRPVTLGPTRGPFAVALSGVSAGEELLVQGHRQVVDGQAITITEQPPCCRAQLEPPTPTATEGRMATSNKTDVVPSTAARAAAQP